jgi:hypothetical protein
MTAAPDYTWEFIGDMFGDRVPKVATLGLTANAQVKKGTLLSMVAGDMSPTTDGTGAVIVGLSLETIDVNPTVHDPVKVAMLFPGAIIKGTAVSTAAAHSGFVAKTYDLDSDGRLDPTDTTAGGLSVWRTEDSGLTVYCVCAVGAAF